jgi:hypothetical protein
MELSSQKKIFFIICCILLLPLPEDAALSARERPHQLRCSKRGKLLAVWGRCRMRGDENPV